MDPDENLKEQLELARRIIDVSSEGWPEDDARRLAELVLALHEWLQAGGFLPRAWSQPRA